MKKLLLALFLLPSLALAQSSSVYEVGQAKPTDDIYGTLGACLGPTNTENFVCTANGLKVDAAAVEGMHAEDSAHQSGDKGVLSLGIKQATLSSTADTAGDYAGQIQDDLGATWVNPTGKSSRVCVAITPDTAAYQAGEVVRGTGLTTPLEFANVFRGSLLGGYVSNVEITNTESDSIGWNLCLFTAATTTSTVTDQGAMAITAADLQKWLGCYGVNTQSTATTELYQGTIGRQVVAAGTSLYGVLLTAGAPTWAAAQTVNVCITTIQD